MLICEQRYKRNAAYVKCFKCNIHAHENTIKISVMWKIMLLYPSLYCKG